MIGENIKKKKWSILFPYKKVLRRQEDILAMHKKVENPLAHPFTLRGSRLSFFQNIKDVWESRQSLHVWI